MKNFLLLILIPGFSAIFAQSREDFKKFGHQVYDDLIVEGSWDSISMIRVREYRDYIRLKVEGEFLQNKLIHQVNEHHFDEHGRLQTSLQSLLDNYALLHQDSGSTSFLHSYYFEKTGDDLPDTYTMIVSFLFEKGEMQTEVRLQFDIIWYLDQFLLISDIKESF